MKLILCVLLVLLSLTLVVPPVWADPSYDKIAASLDRIERALATRPPMPVVQADPITAMIDEFAKTQMALLRFEALQGLMSRLTPQRAAQPERRSFFGLTNGGPQGAVTGAAVGGLLSHIGVFDPSGISLGTAILGGLILGQ